MPNVGVEKELDKLLGKARAETRYVDMRLVLRRPMAYLIGPPGRAVHRDEEFRHRDGDAVIVVRPVLHGAERVYIPPSGELVIPVSSAPEAVGASSRIPAGVELEGAPDIVARFAPEDILCAGGSWDRLRNAWARGRTAKPHVIDLEESQVEFVRWYAGWLAAFRERRERADSAAIVYGGRRGGKTFACLLCLVATVIDVPNSLGWAVSVSHVERDVDIDRNVKLLIPDAWFTYREWPAHKFTFLNGSTITNVSADDPEGAKRGQVDVVLINEGAKMPELVYENSLGGTTDRGGIVIVASNPPQTTRGEWVEIEVQAAAEAVARGQEPDARVFQVNPDLNRTIDQRARSRIKRILMRLNPAMAAADSDGIMRPVGDRALYCFDRLKHAIHGLPQIGDATREATRRRCGRPYDYIMGADFQKRPAIAATIWRVYGDPKAPDMWCVAAFLVEGDEDDFLDAIDTDGRFNPQNTIVVADATGEKQNYEHASGKTSWEPFERRAWHVVGPDETKNRKPVNPKVELSLGRFNRVLLEGRVHIVPDLPVQVTLGAGAGRALIQDGVAVAFKEARSEKGRWGLAMKKGDKHAHLVDTGRYASWWIDPPKDPVQLTSQYIPLSGGAKRKQRLF